MTPRLNIVPTSESACIEIRLVRTYCLIQEENYEEALKEIDRGIPENLVCFEKACCFYKLNKHNEALEVIQTKEVDNQVNHDAWLKLKAQVVRKSSGLIVS